MSGHCTDVDETGKKCRCKKYQDPDHLVPPVHCRECGHGRSHHDGPEEPHSLNANATVTAIIQNLKGSSEKLKEAREETNKHFRNVDGMSSGTTAKTKGKKGKTAEGFSTRGRGRPPKPVRIQSILALPYGLDGSEALNRTKVPAKLRQRELRDCGLGVWNDELSFEKSWGPARMHTYLRENIPALFTYMAQEYPWVMDIDEDDDDGLLRQELPYVLLARHGGYFNLSNIAHPTGKDYAEFKGRDGAAWSQCHIFIATRVAIDREVYIKWKNVTAASGNDEEEHSETREKSPVGKRTLPIILEDTTTDEELEQGLEIGFKLRSGTKRMRVSSDNEAGPSTAEASGSRTPAPTSGGVHVDIDLTEASDDDVQLDAAPTEPFYEQPTTPPPLPQSPAFNVQSSPDVFASAPDPWANGSAYIDF